MAIQVRRGNESDFNASKMLPGEWAVSLDTKYVRMCFAPGVVLRMATYEGFEADKAQFQAILAGCRSIQSAVQRIQAEVNSKASLVVEYSNNAKTSADKAHSEAERAKTYADNAEAVTGVQIATKERAGLIKGGDNHIAEDGTLMLITTTDSTTQPNSHAGRENILEIGGVTEQDSTSGKNLLPNTASSTTVNGVTFTVNTDGTVLVNGTATADTPFVISYAPLKAGNYILSGCPKGGAWNTYSLQYNFGKQETGDGLAITIENDGTPNVRILVSNGATVTNALFKPMIRLASVADATYEPYTGGIPAPNPSYPMEIKNSVVSGVKTHGKNFLKNEWESKLPTNENYHALRVRCKKVIPIRKGVAYTFSANDYTNYKYALNVSRTGAYPFDVNEIHSLGNSADWLNKASTFTALDDGYLSVVVSKADDTNLSLEEVAKLKIQFEAGTVATPYEPYTSSEYTFSQPIDLYGMNGVQDIFTAKQTKRRFVKYVLDGSDDENWTKEAGYDYVFRHRHGFSNAIAYSLNQLCTHLLRSSSYNGLVAKEGYFAISSSSLLINVSGITTSPDLKSFLAENPMTFVFDLSEEVTEELPIADQIGLNSLATYDGITYVEFDAEIQPTFKAEYGTSKVGGYTLESLLTARNNELKQNMVNERLSALESSVVNNI